MNILTLTVFFEEPFWVGVFERVSAGKLSVRKVTFGAEPKDCEVYDFILKRYDALQFSETVEMNVRRTADNPKRRQRNVKKQLRNAGIGTKSQQALQKQREAYKIERRRITKEERDAEKRRQRALKERQRKEKRRGH
ncbi:MAG: YjdF family protein [Oscillospiraceae bacterium]|nr:YjdF family protein [Oscillospiraceae bacterium]